MSANGLGLFDYQFNPDGTPTPQRLTNYTYQMDISTMSPSGFVGDNDADKFSSMFAWTGPGFLHGFVSSLSLIIVSELGDKTFFIAAILAMKNSRMVVFVASMLALGIMTVLASALGVAANIIPKAYIHYTSVVLFILFGLKMLKEGYDMGSDEAQEEINAVESSLEKRDSVCNEKGVRLANGTNQVRSYTSEDPETGVISSIPEVPLSTKIRRKFLSLVSLAFIQTFTMIFIAEWGDRSQISTLVLAARENFVSVTLGALLGHFLCTGLAVLGGRFIATKISVKTVTIVGGFVFLIFAAVSLLMPE